MSQFGKVKIVLFALICLFLLSAETSAQKRRRTPVRAARTSAAANTAAVAEASQKVADEIKALSRYLYVLGNSINSLDAVDRDIKTGKASQSARNSAELGRKGIVQTITIFRNEMLGLEDRFRASNALKPYLLQLTGVGELTGTAEEQASKGQFDAAGRTLLEVINQLADTLKAMP